MKLYVMLTWRGTYREVLGGTFVAFRKTETQCLVLPHLFDKWRILANSQTNGRFQTERRINGFNREMVGKTAYNDNILM